MLGDGGGGGGEAGEDVVARVDLAVGHGLRDLVLVGDHLAGCEGPPGWRRRREGRGGGGRWPWRGEHGDDGERTTSVLHHPPKSHARPPATPAPAVPYVLRHRRPPHVISSSFLRPRGLHPGHSTRVIISAPA